MNTDKHCRVRLVERIDCSDDLALFRFRPEESLDFTPGQYATLGLEDETRGRLLQRPYSVASAPHEDTLDFFVELVEEGALTERLWNLDIGGEAWVRRRIVGLFVLDRESGRRQHLMAATVTGIAPYVSIVRAQQHALEQGTLDEPHRFLVIHGASRSWEFGPYLEELTTAEQSGWLTYVPTVSRPWEDPGWRAETGRVGDVVRKHMDAEGFTTENAVGYACGHPQMIENVREILTRARFDEEHFHEEKYFRESKATTPSSASTPSKVPASPR